MEYEYLTPFEQEEFSFCGAHRFSSKEYSFLLSRNGTSIVLQNTLADLIVEHQLSEDLAFKLYQRGFGRVYGQERFKDLSDRVYPTLFMIDFTTKCNCNCIYCLRHFENEGESISPDMLKRIVRYIIEYCHKYQVNHISFQPWGGEPLIELSQILVCKRMFDEAHIQTEFNIQTNGLLLNLSNYEKLRANHIGIGVSLDGIEAVHDSHRLDIGGNTTHQRIVRNLQEILNKYPDADIGTLSVNSVYSKEYIAENVDYLVNKMRLQGIKFNLVHPNGTDSFDYSMLIQEDSLEEYVNTLLDSVIEQVLAGRKCWEANIMDRLSNLLDRSNKNICNSMGCRGGISFISFDQNGNIYPCEMLGRVEYCLGNIADENNDLLELIQRAKKYNGYYAPRKTEACVECPYLYFCRGGCKASCLAYGKQPCQIDQIECKLNQILYPKLIELILVKPEIVERMLGQHIQMR